MGIGISPTIGHGPADVELGFSVNQNVMRDNMTPETIVSLRNGLTASTVDRSTDLLNSVKDSKLKCLLFLEERSWASKANNALKEIKS